ncbi:MAG: PDZ domain-containing protein [Pirellulaceae bacterium]
MAVIETTTLVSSVTLGSAAEQAGIMPNDRLTHIDGISIIRFDDLREQLGKHVAGEQVEVQLRRQGVDLTVVATLGEEPDS